MEFSDERMISESNDIEDLLELKSDLINEANLMMEQNSGKPNASRLRKLRLLTL